MIGGHHIALRVLERDLYPVAVVLKAIDGARELERAIAGDEVPGVVTGIVAHSRQGNFGRHIDIGLLLGRT